MAGVDVGSNYKPNKDVDTFPQDHGRAVTGEDGTYTLSLLLYGTCHIIAGGVTTSSVNSRDFSTKPDAQVQIEDLIVRPANATVSDKVVDENGKPLVNIEVKSGSGHKRAMGVGIRTDLEGKFTLTHLLEDEPVGLSARGPDFSSGTAYAAPNSSDALIVLHPNKQMTALPTQHHPLPDLIGKPAPDWTVDAGRRARKSARRQRTLPSRGAGAILGRLTWAERALSSLPDLPG